MTNFQKQQILDKKRNPVEWKWCTFCKTYHKKEVFYKNATHSDGLANQCKVASRAQYQVKKFNSLFTLLPYKEKQLYAM